MTGVMDQREEVFAVDWEGPNDPENPKNWPNLKRWRITLLNSLFMFVSPVSSSMVAPAFSEMKLDLSIHSDYEAQMILSIFVLASAVGPLIISPLSELYGRRPVLHITCLIYLIFNLACPFARNRSQLMAFRFLSGIGGSAPSLGGGILADCWRTHERGVSLSVYYIFPLMGPAVGPIIGGFIVRYASWHWMFYATSVLSAAIQVAGIFWLPETYGPTILRRRAKKLRNSTQNHRIRTPYDKESRWDGFRHAMIRPFKLLFTQPIIWLLALFIAYSFGLMYLALSTYFAVWIDIYKDRPDIAGLNYVSLGLGFACATQVCASLNDTIYSRLKRSNNGLGKPEFRIPLLVPGVLLVPIGFFWYGWSIQARLHWIMPNVGAFIFSLGITTEMQCTTSYIIDAYSIYAASAIAATTVLRAIAAFAFPLFAPYMYKSLDYGWANSILALAAIVLGWPAVWLFWVFGEFLRQRSPYTAQLSD
ncbi:related to synaptic vesicle transporter SVOP and related transporters (major facilitator superfamily) [Rhynchosporium secalis]|uniref:Related to synaptic vesicle transporter SVOP and related transporters (Major facilitator superfamily) n=1 Tax=Rhynchosporium secalis TaxID=38038 RepID=A0A1E1MHK7_RHYSE|nr:related to synaptic vesicle transporter SVOP and related transporters (major facilitator superfamily) [Rhynchosporium secalis]